MMYAMLHRHQRQKTEQISKYIKKKEKKKEKSLFYWKLREESVNPGRKAGMCSFWR